MSCFHSLQGLSVDIDLIWTDGKDCLCGKWELANPEEGRERTTSQ